VFLALLLSGCGSGGSLFGGARVPGGASIGDLAQGNGGTGGAHGTLKVDLIFPTVPAQKQANATHVDFPNTSTVITHVLDPVTHHEVIAPTTSQRPEGALQMSILIPGLTPGTYDVFVECVDPQGNSAGYAIPQATVVANETVTVQVSGTITVSSITVTPSTASVAVGATQQYTAVAAFSNGTSSDVTFVSLWASSATNVGTVGASTGLATGVTAGTTLITAALGATTSAPVTLNVTGGHPSPTPTPDPYYYGYDKSNSRVIKFDDSHTFFQAYGTAGDPTTQGQFGTLTSVMHDQDKIYVLSLYNDKYYVTEMNDDMSGNGWITFKVPDDVDAERLAGMVESNGKIYLWVLTYPSRVSKFWQVDAQTGANTKSLVVDDTHHYTSEFWAHKGQLYLLQASKEQGTPPRIKRLDSIAGDNVTTWEGDPYSSTDWITVDRLDRIYWSDYNLNRVTRIDDMTGANRIDLDGTVNSVHVGPLQAQVNGQFHIAVNGEEETSYLYFWDDMGGANGHRDFGSTGSGDWQTGDGNAPSW